MIANTKPVVGCIMLLVLLCGCAGTRGSARGSLACHDEAAIWAMRTHRVTFEQVEAEHKHLRTLPLWLEFKKRARRGDEVWYWTSPPESWPALVGRAGYFIYRDGRLIACILTKMS